MIVVMVDIILDAAVHETLPCRILLSPLASYAYLSILDTHSIGVRMGIELLFLLEIAAETLGLRDGTIFML